MSIFRRRAPGTNAEELKSLEGGEYPLATSLLSSYTTNNFLKKGVIATCCMSVMGLLIIVGVYPRHGCEYSIAIYEGPDPLHLYKTRDGPIITTRQLGADVFYGLPYLGAADPCLIIEGSTWYIFFETIDKNDHGDIGVSFSTDNGNSWVYIGLVLDEKFHISYPNVFAWQGKYYMTPETYKTNSIRLYEATFFPKSWKLNKVLLRGKRYTDPSTVFHDNKWYIFASNAYVHDTMFLFVSDDLFGPWSEHPKSPIISGNPGSASTAGRVTRLNDTQLIRYAQDCTRIYGESVLAFFITELTPTSYAEEPVSDSPIVKASYAGPISSRLMSVGFGPLMAPRQWNAAGMHHLSPLKYSDRWIAAVDGCGYH